VVTKEIEHLKTLTDKLTVAAYEVRANLEFGNVIFVAVCRCFSCNGYHLCNME